MRLGGCLYEMNGECSIFSVELSNILCRLEALELLLHYLDIGLMNRIGS